MFVDFAGDRFADEADAVDDAGVIQFVGKDDVVGATERGEEGFVGAEAADVAEGGGGADEAGDCFFDFAVAVERAADEADGGGAGSVFLQAFDAGGDHFRMVGEAEVVIGAEDDDFAIFAVGAGNVRGGSHWAGEALEVLELARVGERLQEVGGAGVEGGVGHGEVGGSA